MKRGNFARGFEKWGHVPPIPPVPTFMGQTHEKGNTNTYVEPIQLGTISFRFSNVKYISEVIQITFPPSAISLIIIPSIKEVSKFSIKWAPFMFVENVN